MTSATPPNDPSDRPKRLRVELPPKRYVTDTMGLVLRLERRRMGRKAASVFEAAEGECVAKCDRIMPCSLPCDPIRTCPPLP